MCTHLWVYIGSVYLSIYLLENENGFLILQWCMRFLTLSNRMPFPLQVDHVNIPVSEQRPHPR